MTHALSPTHKFVKPVLLTLAIALGILLIPNLPIFDEQPLAEIEDLLQQQATDTLLPDNAAVAIYGLPADSSLDAFTVGKQILEHLKEKHDRQQNATLDDADYAKLFQGKDLDSNWQANYPVSGKCNPRDQLNCFELSLDEIRNTPITNDRLIAQLQRYQQIRQQPVYHDPIRHLDFSSPLPNFGIALHLSRLSNAEAYNKNGLDELIATTRDDMKFWQLVLKESDTILGKMVAINALRGNLQALSYAIRNENNLSALQISQLQSLTTPLSVRDLNFNAAITGEFIMLINSGNQMREWLMTNSKSKYWLLYPLTQPQASINLSYQYSYKPATLLSQLSAAEFHQQTQLPTKTIKFSRLNPYNLGGKVNLVTPTPYFFYIGRGHDLAGIYSLVQLQLALKEVAPDEIAEHIKTAQYKNPYTLQAFDYIPQQKQLGFRCFDGKDICSIHL